ncbi:MAG: hypothetical protein ACLPGW_07975, partial [Roseiarcus sp.]
AKIAADIFFPMIRVRAMLNPARARQGVAGPLIVAEAAQKNGDNAIPGRLTHNPLSSLETAKEKVWKSLEKPGKVWTFLGISLEQFVNPWKSLGLRPPDSQPPDGPASAGERSARRATRPAENRVASR